MLVSGCAQLLLSTATQREAHRFRHLARQSPLHAKDVLHLGVERLLPTATGLSIGDLDQFRTHLHATAITHTSEAHRSSEEVVHTKLVRDLARQLGRPAILCRASPSDHCDAGERRELAAHGIGDPVGEVGVRGVAKVLERQDGDAARV